MILQLFIINNIQQLVNMLSQQYHNIVLQWLLNGERVQCSCGSSSSDQAAWLICWSTRTVSLCHLNIPAMDLVFVSLIRKKSFWPSQYCRFSYSSHSSFSLAHDRVSRSIFYASQIQLFHQKTALCREYERERACNNYNICKHEISYSIIELCGKNKATLQTKSKQKCCKNQCKVRVLIICSSPYCKTTTQLHPP